MRHRISTSIRTVVVSSAVLATSYLMFNRLFAAFRPSTLTPNIVGPPTQPTTATAKAAMSSASSSSGPQYFTGANGCFWGPQQMYDKHYKGKGVLETKVGYIGGHTKDPDYRAVCSGRTGHAEAIQVKFDPSQVSYAELVEFLFRSHDPTQKDKQGADVGTQYRSAIFPHGEEQTKIANQVMSEVQEKVSNVWRSNWRFMSWQYCHTCFNRA